MNPPNLFIYGNYGYNGIFSYLYDMKILISEEQLRLIIEQNVAGNVSDINSYPSCVSVFVKGSGILSRPEGKLVKSNSGQYYVTISRYPKYFFYNNGSVMKPDGKMGRYTCENNQIVVDGINLHTEYWKTQKGQYTTNYEKNAQQNATTMLNNMNSPEYFHNVLSLFSIASAFIPVIGPFLSAGISLGNAGVYYKQGRTKEAGLTAVLGMIPAIGSIGRIIPGVTKLGVNGMQNLGAKMISIEGGSLAKLNQIEMEVVEGIKKNVGFLNREIDKHITNLANKALKETLQPTVKETIKNVAVNGVQAGKDYAVKQAAQTGYNISYDALKGN